MNLKKNIKKKITNFKLFFKNKTNNKNGRR